MAQRISSQRGKTLSYFLQTDPPFFSYLLKKDPPYFVNQLINTYILFYLQFIFFNFLLIFVFKQLLTFLIFTNMIILASLSILNIMFKGKRFKQQSKLNASTTQNQLPLAHEDSHNVISFAKSSKDCPKYKSVCAKMDMLEIRRKKYSLPHKDNPQVRANIIKFQQKYVDNQGKRNMNLKIKANHNLTNHYYLKIKQKISSDVTPIIRIILIDWLLQVVVDLELRRQAFHKAIYYLDQLLLKINITKKELQVYGVCCLMIAQKLQSQKILTPLQTSQLLNCPGISERTLIDCEEIIMKTLEFKLHPVTLWTQMSVLLKAFESYFKDKLNENWTFYQNRILWIIDGVVMQNSYFGNNFLQRETCISILFFIISEYQPQLIRYFSQFYKSITGKEEFNHEDMNFELRYSSQWLKKDCNCIFQYTSEHYHPQLKKMAASHIANN